MELFLIFLIAWGLIGISVVSNFVSHFNSNNPWQVFFAGPIVWIILLALKIKGF